jgi:hypothetical protein
MKGAIMKLTASLAAITAVAGAALPLGWSTASATSAQASSSLPTISIAMDRKSITVSGTLVSGAVNIRSTVTNERLGEPTLVHLNAGVSYAQAFRGIGQTSDPNAITPYGSIVFNAVAPRGPSSAETMLEPGNYIALDTARGAPPFPFTNSRSRRPPHPWHSRQPKQPKQRSISRYGASPCCMTTPSCGRATTAGSFT